MRHFILLFLSLFSFISFGNKTASEIYVDLQKVHSLKRVLYIAAHPDDENTRALAWFSLGEKAETAYLSLTRGDGGQNLIGDELSEDLGVLRTQELLAARRIDRAKQFFSRAVDFGYSKSAEETFEKWGKNELLADVVLVIRQFKPDVIITRFPPDKRGGHGHHTASALLAIEAFEKAADPTYLPNQVKEFGIWQATSIYWNSSTWWDKELSTTAKNNPNYLIQDIGGYNPLLGMSYNEIGTIARSQHKCQGFGAIIERGERKEYFEHLGGDKLQTSFFEKNKLTWTQLVNSEFESNFNQILDNFDFVNPEKNVTALLNLRNQLAKMPSSLLVRLKNEKLKRLDEIIINCLGLYIEIVTDDYAYSQNESIKLSYNFVNRSGKDVSITNLSHLNESVKLAAHSSETKEIEIKNQSKISNPYWLEEPFTALFQVKDKSNIGKAESDPSFSDNISLLIENVTIEINIPIVYKWRDPSYGERRRNLISTPDFTANFDQKSAILQPGEKKVLQISTHSFKANVNDIIHFSAPDGWIVSPEKVVLKTEKKQDETFFNITLTPTNTSKRGILKLSNEDGNTIYSLTEITYDHIPTQVIFKEATMACIALDAKIIKGDIAYIRGAGDAMPQAIEQLGFPVTIFDVADLATVDLNKFQSVVLGIRIYNIYPELHNFDEKMWKYVAQGGNIIMQYNTASRNATKSTFGPIPFELSRKRVTEENSEVVFTASDHPIMNSPNKITQTDFDNWVQERGLYFADNWDKAYTPLFAWHDKGEESVNGALIVAKHGKGQFVYTGISFFRELPNGVEGAYRLFANLLSYQP